MEINSKMSASSRNYVGKVLMDIWMYCPWCGVREWFTHREDKIYTCSHCKNELELK